MTVTRRLALLERSTSGGTGPLTIFVPWAPHPTIDEVWAGSPTTDETARLVAAIEAEGLRATVVFWRWSVEATIASLRRDRDDERRKNGNRS